MEIVGGGGNQQQGQQININISEQPDIVCETCGGKFFEQAFMFKRISKLLTGQPEDTPATIPVFRCQECGTPIQEFLNGLEKGE